MYLVNIPFAYNIESKEAAAPIHGVKTNITLSLIPKSTWTVIYLRYPHSGEYK